tara:strand:- start:201 stop:479 length:279 start_codon:yes stop_codon:yes gene_type:complete
MARKSATVDTCEGRVCTARAAKHGQAAYDAGWEEMPGWGGGPRDEEAHGDVLEVVLRVRHGLADVRVAREMHDGVNSTRAQDLFDGILIRDV